MLAATSAPFRETHSPGFDIEGEAPKPEVLGGKGVLSLSATNSLPVFCIFFDDDQ
jgi:hypothetical protein